MKIFERLRAINSAFFAVLRAELDALTADLGAAGKRYASGALLLGVTLAIGAVLLAVLVFVAIAALALWLPYWGAGLVVAGVLALAGIGCGFAAMRRLRGENPGQIVQRHVHDHLDWWQMRVAKEGEAGSSSLPPGSDGDEGELEEDLP
jgi:hypothetical protein